MNSKKSQFQKIITRRRFVVGGSLITGSAAGLLAGIPLGTYLFPRVPIKTVVGHHDSISHVAISPDGKVLASYAFDGQLALWDIENFRSQKIELIKDFQSSFSGTDNYFVQELFFSQDSRHLVTRGASPVNNMRFWDAHTGKFLKQATDIVRGKIPFRVFDRRYDGAGILAFPDSGKGKSTFTSFINMEAKEEVRTIDPKTIPASNIAITRDKKFLAIIDWGSRGTFIKLWNFKTGKLINVLGSSLSISGLKFSSDGKFLFSGHADNKIRVWEVKNGTLVTSRSSHSKAILCLALSIDGKVLVSGSADKTIKLWDVREMTG